MKVWNNITLKCKLIIFVSLTMISCNNDLQEIQEHSMQDTAKKVSLNKLDEWELLPITKKRISSNFIQNKKLNILEQVNEEINAQHLQELNYYYPFVKEPACNACVDWRINEKAKQCESRLLNLFKKSGIRPDGVCINDFRTRNSYKGYLLSDKYNWHAYIKTGKPRIIEEKTDTLYNGILKSSWAINESRDRDMAYNISYAVTKSKTNYWENIASMSVAVGKKIGIPLIGEGEVTITLGYSHVEGKSETISETFSYTPWIYLAPRTKKQVIMRKKDITRTIKCEIPIIISGYVGVNFPKPVDGHYFWRFPANLLFKDKETKLIYEIKIEEKGEIEVYGGKEIPLD